MMMPKSMKTTWWLAVACIFLLTVGIFFLLVLFVPEFAPQLHKNVMRRGVALTVPLVAAICIGVAVATLWYYSKLDQEPKSNGE